MKKTKNIGCVHTDISDDLLKFTTHFHHEPLWELLSEPPRICFWSAIAKKKKLQRTEWRQSGQKKHSSWFLLRRFSVIKPNYIFRKLPVFRLDYSPITKKLSRFPAMFLGVVRSRWKLWKFKNWKPWKTRRKTWERKPLGKPGKTLENLGKPVHMYWVGLQRTFRVVDLALFPYKHVSCRTDAAVMHIQCAYANFPELSQPFDEIQFPLVSTM